MLLDIMKKNKCNEVYLIAEIGQNHQGCVETAKKMILTAKKAGCNCVKFQKSDLKAKFTRSALDRRYISDHSWGKTYGEHKEYLEFTKEQYRQLQAYSNEIEIDFTASAMDEVYILGWFPIYLINVFLFPDISGFSMRFKGTFYKNWIWGCKQFSTSYKSC